MNLRKAAALLSLAVFARAGYDPLSITGAWLIDGYKVLLSPLQGRGMCNFWPTCSQFTKEAIQRHGFLPGVVMGADRLMRCSPFAWSYLGRFYHGIEKNRICDPVANHSISIRHARCQMLDGRSQMSAVRWRKTDGGQRKADSASPSALLFADSRHSSIIPRHSCESRNPGLDSRLRGNDRKGCGNDKPSVSTSALLFADRLFLDGAYLPAATEFLRLRFSTTSVALRNYAGLMAGESYLKAGELGRARYTFQEFAAPEIAEFTSYGIGRTLFAEGRYSEARPLFEKLGGRGRVYAAWCLFREMKFASGAQLLACQSADSIIARLAQMDGRRIPKRSRCLSSLLSLVVPGAGQLYSGRAGDGLYAFLTVASTGLASYWFATHPDKDRDRVKLVLFASLAALFHAGNVFGANIAARDYNDYQRRRYLASAEELFKRLQLEPDYRPLLDSLGTAN